MVVVVTSASQCSRYIYIYIYKREPLAEKLSPTTTPHCIMFTYGTHARASERRSVQCYLASICIYECVSLSRCLALAGRRRLERRSAYQPTHTNFSRSLCLSLDQPLARTHGTRLGCAPPAAERAPTPARKRRPLSLPLSPLSRLVYIPTISRLALACASATLEQARRGKSRLWRRKRESERARPPRLVTRPLSVQART